MLNPLFDFAGDIPCGSCPKRAGIVNELAHEACVAVLGSSLTLTASEDLKGQVPHAQLMAEIFKGALSCDDPGTGAQ